MTDPRPMSPPAWQHPPVSRLAGLARRLRVVAASAAAAAVASSCGAPEPAPTHPPAQEPPRQELDLAHQIPGRDLRRDPPAVEGLSLQVVDATSGVLRVTFAGEDRLPPALSIAPDGASVTLRDDGRGGDETANDRAYAATVPLDAAALERNQKRIEALAGTPLPAFAGRVKLPDVRLPTTPFERLAPKKVIDLLPKFPQGNAANVDAARSLMVVDPGVTQDPTRTRTACATGSMGKWSFGYLMSQMANQPATGVSPSDFVLRWLQRWEFLQVANDWPVPARSQIRSRIIDPWIAASGGPGNPLDLSKAPFRLLAIVNRVDLRENLIYGGGSAGEARFVFAALDQDCNAMQFTVIFEYGIHKNGCVALKAWAQQWKDLDQHAVGSPAYNAALEAITEQFVVAGAAPSKPNGSALNQLRTNEIALSDPWELREFQLTSASAGFLDLVTVKQTPDLSLNQQPVLANFVNGNLASVLAGTHQVPLQFPPGSPFLGASSPTPFGLFWDAPGMAPGQREARFQFSLATCSGCHAGETQTSFTHIAPTGFGGGAAGQSGFLTGITGVTDPADGTPARDFNDLQRRAADLDQLLNTPCFSQIAFRPLRMVH